MPTVRQNISYAYTGFMRAHRPAVRHLAKSILAILAVAFLLETFLFNLNYFTSAGYNSISLNDKLNLQETTDEQYKLTAVNHTLEFSNLNTEVHNIWLNFDYRQPAQELTVKIQFTDDAHHTYFDSTEYTVGVPDVAVSTLSDQSEYINLNTAGLVDNLRIEIAGENVSYPIKLSDIVLNAHHPFDFNTGRFLATAGILLLAFAFRPRSAIYRIHIVDEPRKSKAAIIATVVIEVYLMSAFLFMGSNLVGVATQGYNSGSWDGHSIVNTFEVGGDNAQQYAELAKAMAHGQLYLEEEPPQWLQDMADPYDKGARDEAQKETGEPYLFDVAYHDGHYYVYFGVVPVVLFYLPFYLLTGANFPTAIGVLIACVAFVLGCSALLDRFARYHFKRVSLGLYLLLQIPLVTCCGILYLLKFPTFYSLPIMLGLAFSVWGLYFWMRGRASAARSTGPEKWYLAGSLCMALVVGCRPQLVVLSLLAFPLFWRAYITERRLFTPRGAREFACLVAPYAVVAAGLMGYNYARFGSLTDFGANYNLTVNDMTKRGWNLGRLAPALFAYFLQPPCVTGVFPYVQPAPFDTTYMGQTIKEVTFGGILACLPVLWVLPFAKRILALRMRQRSTRTIMGVIVVLLASGVIVALLDAQMAGILQRYFADFSFMFLAAVVLLAFIVNENLSPGTMAQNLLMKVLLVLVAVSVVYSVLVCFVPETGWYSDVYSWAYQDVIETAQFWT
ncbi:cytochrome C oxidase Cbb3 [Gordonibacter urolithinfaciens]|uniref:Cytochrome C oxidase Cbb3 n=1 Tax=Gordonibacter urolithinfaciens TaxID=1335613 RepID=A0A6N8IEZ7_9ACTN|nr:cytochrome C oxidase Cbb3 [Gordonibacter urolithinfaciens]MVM54714.1 cytochrome C oxidase Cbb3 [Gordonibacter urolithinfaciens]MVN14342.1 cytochrome C oxidase Cbb3 [Gordonibacter urolithinfaciens]MVN38696.1 cytochrome C oxidase Cbb3 [Gordonibacter urolithinfaciens]MVN56647.1 cytochrome C oxidase Cbb3 [Gordonibacter urolithinfaciens]MVN60757.1 cytochrome C oxidase Cbb3 [Gordonibacter urolithinfaciens]